MGLSFEIWELAEFGDKRVTDSPLFETGAASLKARSGAVLERPQSYAEESVKSL
jgi:hypothetical protein